jgi:hypothetical protein
MRERVREGALTSEHSFRIGAQTTLRDRTRRSAGRHGEETEL